MNTRHKNLKFTFDFEQNNSFSILDVKITRGSNGLPTSVFRKTTFSEFPVTFTKQILFLHYCSAVLQFAQICIVFL